MATPPTPHFPLSHTLLTQSAGLLRRRDDRCSDLPPLCYFVFFFWLNREIFRFATVRNFALGCQNMSGWETWKLKFTCVQTTKCHHHNKNCEGCFNSATPWGYLRANINGADYYFWKQHIFHSPLTHSFKYHVYNLCPNAPIILISLFLAFYFSLD